MKISNTLISKAGVLIVFAILALSSCCDKCEYVNCDNGICDDGYCDCFDGYYGDNCQYTYNTGGGSGGSGSGGGSGGASTGSAMFWAYQLHCGPITVSLNGVGTSTITTAANSSPSCGTAGYANFYDLAPGTYSYTATCSNGTWSNTIYIDSGVCDKIQLTL